MGFVKVEVAFEGLDCRDCLFEEFSGIGEEYMDNEEIWNFCGLFDQDKGPGKRCAKCLFNEVYETPACGGDCACAL